MQNIVVIRGSTRSRTAPLLRDAESGFWRWIVCTSTPTLKTLPPEAKLAELCALMYDDDGNCKQTLLDAFPARLCGRCPVVVCGGFIP